MNSIPSTINPVVSTSNFENQIKVTPARKLHHYVAALYHNCRNRHSGKRRRGASLTIIRLS